MRGMTSAERLLADIEAFLSETGTTASAFGRAAASDPNFVGDLRGGRKPNLDLADRVWNFIETRRAELKQHGEAA
jgi:hypothetical protein